jgi:hypothetical protein
MIERLNRFLGEPAVNLLMTAPFSQWRFERSIDDDLPERIVNYGFAAHGLSLVCDDGDEKIQTIFLYASRFDQSLIEISFSSSRQDVLNDLGEPTKSGEAHTHAILGDYGAWDRFDGTRCVVHVEYQPDVDRIKMITLMRTNIAP